ncbi:hypothetical protein FH972_022455 [Carpinus fangiana]|uniref:Uncharacterized protein n=1 Tax=Carpinus fangiana TaxID=176857 RepID=A0A5N6KSB1_9ROSI|nr:hypothetical protein FH972_022455 [Carpinus fangiana]
MAATTSAFMPIEDPPSPLDDPSDADSLPESGSTSSSDENLHIQSDADREWRESLQQVELLLTMVLIPYIGWTKYMTWMYPVEVVVTNQAAFKGVGIIEAASPI